MPKFILEIELGGGGRQEEPNIIRALKGAVGDLERVFDLFDTAGKPIPPNKYPVYGCNGNTVGFYQVVE